jgi:hypothetical protein
LGAFTRFLEDGRVCLTNNAAERALRAGRLDELKLHPTVKPVAMVAEAIKDRTRRGDVVLDSFCGSGTTIMAAERVGRARALEIEPRFVDAAVRRWQAYTRRDAIHAETGLTFDQTMDQNSMVTSAAVSRIPVRCPWPGPRGHQAMVFQHVPQSPRQQRPRLARLLCHVRLPVWRRAYGDATAAILPGWSI